MPRGVTTRISLDLGACPQASFAEWLEQSLDFSTIYEPLGLAFSQQEMLRVSIRREALRAFRQLLEDYEGALLDYVKHIGFESKRAFESAFKAGALDPLPNHVYAAGYLVLLEMEHWLPLSMKIESRERLSDLQGILALTRYAMNLPLDLEHEPTHYLLHPVRQLEALLQEEGFTWKTASGSGFTEFQELSSQWGVVEVHAVLAKAAVLVSKSVPGIECRLLAA